MPDEPLLPRFPTPAARPEAAEQLPEVMTVLEAAAYLRIHHKTLLRLIHDGRVPARKLGTAWRLSRRQLLAIVEGAPDPAGAPGVPDPPHQTGGGQGGGVI